MSDTPTQPGFETGRLAAALNAQLFGGPEASLTLGRYRVIDVLGSGGMGVVYRAYEPELDRMVALKVIRPRMGVDSNASYLARFVREGRTMAKLVHPHVVTVHEAGREGDIGYLAMEFLGGGTLAAWARKCPPGTRERLEALLDYTDAAIDGLIAAHEQSVVHRDIKPENLLLDDRGQLKVADFGVAQTAAADHAASAPDSVDRTRTDSSITATDEVVGTPRYAAPEQLSGEATPASDQFSLCLSVYELATGRYPFASMYALGLEPGDSLDGEGLPRWLVGVLQRGLARDPQRRYSHLGELREALRRGRRPSRRRAAVVAGLALVVGMGGFAFSRESEHPCAELESWWASSQAATLASAYEATGAPLAVEAAERVAEGIEVYADRWGQARRSLCEAQRRGEEGRVLDGQRACLARRRTQAEALVHRLSSADQRAVDRDVRVLDALLSVDSCMDEDRVLAQRFDPPPAADEDAVAQVREAIAGAVALRETGAIAEAHDGATAALEAALRTEHKPTIAEAWLELGEVERLRSERAATAEAGRQAFVLARASRNPSLSAQAAALLTWADGEASVADRGLFWSEVAMAEAAAVPRSSFRGHVLAFRAERLVSAGRLTEAAAVYERLLEGASNPYGVAAASTNAAPVYILLGDEQRAMALSRRAVDSFSQSIGANHPVTLNARLNLGVAMWDAGDLETAEHAFAEIAALREQLVGADTAATRAARYNLALVSAERGNFARARTIMRELEGAAVKGSLEQAQAALERGGIEASAGEVESAKALTTRGLAMVREATSSPVILGQAALGGAAILHGVGDLEGARAELARARELADTFEPSDPWHRELERLEAALTP
jgi:tetratricopeptide (TPR) repeat protein